MKILLEHVAMLALRNVKSGDTIELPEGSTIADLLKTLRLEPSHQRAIVAFVRGERAHPSCVLQDGDDIFLGLPVGGG